MKSPAIIGIVAVILVAIAGLAYWKGCDTKPAPAPAPIVITDTLDVGTPKLDSAYHKGVLDGKAMIQAGVRTVVKNVASYEYDPMYVNLAAQYLAQIDSLAHELCVAKAVNSFTFTKDEETDTYKQHLQFNLPSNDFDGTWTEMIATHTQLAPVSTALSKWSIGVHVGVGVDPIHKNFTYPHVGIGVNYSIINF